MFSLYLAALLLLGTTGLQQEIRLSNTADLISNEQVASQFKVNSVQPLFAEINFSGLQQIVVHSVKGFEKSSSTFLKSTETHFLVKWKSAILRSISIEPGLTIAKIIFPFHFFW
jgi:hypothetical protein